MGAKAGATRREVSALLPARDSESSPLRNERQDQISCRVHPSHAASGLAGRGACLLLLFRVRWTWSNMVGHGPPLPLDCVFRPNRRTESDESTAALLAGSHWGKALFWGDPATAVQVRAHTETNVACAGRAFN